VVGGDISPETVAYSQKYYRRDNLTFEVMDVRDIPYPDQSFDVVVSFETIEHIVEGEQFLREVVRLLDDDGVDGIFFIAFAAYGTEMMEPLVDLVGKRAGKPFFVSLLGGADDIARSRAYLMEREIPIFDFPETGLRVFSRMWQYARRLKSKA